MELRNQLESPLFTHFISDYTQPVGPDLLGRTEDFFRWQESRRETGLWPFSRSLVAAPEAECGVRNETGVARQGLNFGSQDYLSLSTHPEVIATAHRAIEQYGLHSAGSAMLGGNTTPSLMLEKALAEHLQMPHVALFSSGWGAGFGTIAGLVRADDHVVMDALSHQCLQQGAMAATQNVTRVPHLNNRAMRRKLQEIRAKDTRNGVLVVTEGLFSMDSDVPRLEELQAICHEYGATLLVDVAHDLGSLGPRGTGVLGAQGMLGKVDLVVGAFSKTFASNGGFLATRSPAVRQFVRTMGGPHIFSNALLPTQAAVVLEALRIVRSEEGEALRQKARANILALRGAFAERGIKCMGEPSNVVPVPVGDAKVARLASKLVFERGVFANLVEYPAVRVRESRFRMQVMSSHTEEQARHAAEVVHAAIEEARSLVNPQARPSRAARHEERLQAEV
ncbi:aminotransferase class I/II-fold pyridoxal phosphate-dependent enzyme [Pyxidicoccus fallax]|uniref:Aminotransferase class I/II-fold pyridoxal phosphate-dependent enzyme n=1 Tax=Pyxidicoccus fallax TaxID=394095 RepID=A0A848LS57_9BACT|nr:aminotransferase class I/II-fold pyridoxal phosphate-dependent enzyme [Pyxidicoccus fallax]NMO20787.1 aminotransferase class I/II-fold pyridoxal phosphate-dependent enzyme [Pyxidicoccus fallax]NPC80609.1 aminotransferase class I/II-fold pyridoxal phosphate-dependent enzyme [Pyxidicoccus fallax]